MDSAGMWKRRVGVTARSRQIVGNQVTGSLQVVTEMAAPSELRTPMGTAAEAAIRVRMEVWRQWRWSRLTDHNPKSEETERESQASKFSGGGAPAGAHEALPHTPPGGKSPPETPGPLSLATHCRGGREFVKGSQAAHKSRALDKFSPSRRRFTGIRERGPLSNAQHTASRRWSGPPENSNMDRIKKTA